MKRKADHDPILDSLHWYGAQTACDLSPGRVPAMAVVNRLHVLLGEDLVEACDRVACGFVYRLTAAGRAKLPQWSGWRRKKRDVKVGWTPKRAKKSSTLARELFADAKPVYTEVTTHEDATRLASAAA